LLVAVAGLGYGLGRTALQPSHRPCRNRVSLAWDEWRWRRTCGRSSQARGSDGNFLILLLLSVSGRRFHGEEDFGEGSIAAM
jgi:hypothetical protein